MITDLFGSVANRGTDVPLMSPSTAASLPPGLQEMLTATDMVIDVNDLRAAIDDPQIMNADPATYTPVTFVEEQNVTQMQNLMDNARNGAAAAHIFYDENMQNGVCITTTTGDREDIFADRLGKFPGTKGDRDAIVMLHENAHCEDAEGGWLASPIGKEVYADYVGAQDYYRAYKNGVVTDPEVPYAFRAMRAMDVMENGDYGLGTVEQHSIGAVIPLPGEQNSVLTQYTTKMAVGEDMLRARDDVLEEIGADHYTMSSFIKLQAVQQLMDEGMPLDPDIALQVREGANFISFDFHEYAPRDLQNQELLGRLIIPPEYGDRLYDVMEERQLQGQRDEAWILLRQQPSLLYEQSRVMLHEGAFDDNPAGEKLIENFIDGVERYNPVSYGVAQSDIPTERPAIVQDAADTYAPRYAANLTQGYGR